jgi:alkanesulfonate monooxygenase SsuD/methylene tetrahydromethanopterin reductase-like flavin-dependent oxidoreductase (luciferase family)
VKFGIFIEQNLPRPWTADDEHRLLKESLEQVELADRLGFDTAWVVEHHFLEEYSHSAAPDVFLAAASQRTKRIRLGHGIVQLPPQINHPFRTAERIATLDLLSDGRVEFGTGESTSDVELEGFGVDRTQKREQWAEAIDAIVRMFVEEPFAGYQGRFVDLPPRNVIPKPRQRPHPPLWVACTREETIQLAASLGIGVLSFNFVSPDEAKRWVDDYYATLSSDACVPVGFAINPNFAVVAPFLCHEDEATAIDLGLEGFDFFRFSGLHYFAAGEHRPGATDLWRAFKAEHTKPAADRSLFLSTGPLAGDEMKRAGIESHRGAVGTPEQIRTLMRAYSDAGVDQVMFLIQGGRLDHREICASLELFAAEVMAEFRDEEPSRQRSKATRLAPAIEAALARREPARDAPDYTIGRIETDAGS